MEGATIDAIMGLLINMVRRRTLADGLVPGFNM